jgi:probable F420-dependent oxidoreductase
MGVKVGVVPVNTGRYLAPGYLAGFARLLEDEGYESVWTFEHVIIPDQYDSVYPYSPTGKLAIAGSDEFVDPLIALTWVAAATERLRLGTGVNILPQANPLYLAKQAASLDHLSGGRLTLGLGVGWLREEYDALGVPFEDRGERADEYIDAMRAAWTGEPVDLQGRFLDWHGWRMRPTPVQTAGGPTRDGQPSMGPGVPIVVGGTTAPAIRRVVTRGDGWYVIHRDLDHFHALMESLRAECGRQGRELADIEITAYWNHHREGIEGARVYAAAGVARLLVNADALRMGDPQTAVRRFAAEVLPRLAV